MEIAYFYENNPHAAACLVFAAIAYVAYSFYRREKRKYTHPER